MPTDWLSQTARKIGDAQRTQGDLLLPAAVLGLAGRLGRAQVRRHP